MANSIRTPRQGHTANSQRIAAAVDNEEWQKFRVSLKGKPTAEKLNKLRAYYYDNTIRGDTPDNICIRIDNYIKALCRGGQLYKGESLKSALEANWDLKIKK